MDDIYSRLEARMKTLIQQYHALKNAYEKLEENQLVLQQEKENLLKKHRHAVTHIENMISHLKTIELMS